MASPDGSADTALNGKPRKVRQRHPSRHEMRGAWDEKMGEAHDSFWCTGQESRGEHDGGNCCPALPAWNHFGTTVAFAISGPKFEQPGLRFWRRPTWTLPRAHGGRALPSSWAWASSAGCGKL